jgi:hypothetical protein
LDICAGTGGRRPTADEVDARLHAERFDMTGRAQRHHAATFADLPDGAFVLEAGEPWLVRGDRLLRWTPDGYATPRPRPNGRAVMITPPMLVAALNAGWEPLVPLLHPSASADQ